MKLGIAPLLGGDGRPRGRAAPGGSGRPVEGEDPSVVVAVRRTRAAVS